MAVAGGALLRGRDGPAVLQGTVCRAAACTPAACCAAAVLALLSHVCLICLSLHRTRTLYM